MAGAPGGGRGRRERGSAARYPAGARSRVAEAARGWDVTVERTLETAHSVLAFGRRGRQPVVVKVARSPDPTPAGPGRDAPPEEADPSARALEAFDGHGSVRMLARAPGATLLERLEPGTHLTALCGRGEDEAATGVLAAVVEAMGGSAGASPTRSEGFPDAARWGASLEAAVERGAGPIPRDLLAEAAARYASLCASQSRVRLLHGDLHHGNVLLGARRGWVAIDPEGVVAELEFELGASLRNPYGMPELFAAPRVVERRIRQFEDGLGIDPARVAGWAFSQAVLAAVWEAEDGTLPEEGSPFLALAATLRPMLPR